MTKISVLSHILLWLRASKVVSTLNANIQCCFSVVLSALFPRGKHLFRAIIHCFHMVFQHCFYISIFHVASMWRMFTFVSIAFHVVLQHCFHKNFKRSFILYACFQYCFCMDFSLCSHMVCFTLVAILLTISRVSPSICILMYI